MVNQLPKSGGWSNWTDVDVEGDDRQSPPKMGGGHLDPPSLSREKNAPRANGWFVELIPGLENGQTADPRQRERNKHVN